MSLRSATQAPEGYCFIDMDLKTAEVVALAYLSGDQGMIDMLNEPDLQFACLKENPDKVVRIAYLREEIVPRQAWDPAKLVSTDDPRLLRREDGSLVHPKRDMHWELSESVAAKIREVLNKNTDRDGVGKVGNFSIPYQGSPSLLERMVEANTGVRPPEGTGQKMIDAYSGGKPVAWRFLKDMMDVAEDPGYYVALSGRIRHAMYSEIADLEGLSEYTRKGILSPLQRQFCNFPMQNLVADTTAKALVNFVHARRQLGLSSRIAMLLYDAMMSICRLEELKATRELLKQCLEGVKWTAHGVTFNFEVDIGVCFRWGCKMTKEEKEKVAPYL